MLPLTPAASDARMSVNVTTNQSGRGLALIRILPIPDEKGAEAGHRETMRNTDRREARLPNLTAATPVVRLPSVHSDTTEAYGMLEPVYASFHEGRDTLPLENARSVLWPLGWGIP